MPDTLVKKNATIADTIALIIARIDHDSKTPFVQYVAREIGDPSNVPAYTKKLFDYVCRNVHYKLDTLGKEDVYKPSRTISDGVGDCKKMTVLIGSVLVAAGIQPLIKHVIYDNAEYTHVYIIVPRNSGYITVDPVNEKKYNSEVKYAHSQVFDTKGNRMDLYTGAAPQKPLQHKFIDATNQGVNSIFEDLQTISCNRTMSGADQNAIIDSMFSDETIGATVGKKKKKTKAERKERRKKVADKFKNVGLAIPRGAFLALVKLNGFSLASHLSILLAKYPGVLEGFWNKVGGDVKALKQAVLDGAKKKAVGTGQTFAAIVASATPIIAAVVKILKDHNLVTEDGGDLAESLTDNSGDDSASQKKSTKTIKNLDGTVRPAPSSAKLDAAVEEGEDAIHDNEVDPNEHKDLADHSGKPNVTPTHGSFFSAFGMCFWGSMQIMAIQQSLTNNILLFISGIIGLYFFIGLVPGMIYQSNHRFKKYIAWYFDTPKKFFSLISSRFKKYSLKKYTHEA